MVPSIEYRRKKVYPGHEDREKLESTRMRRERRTRKEKREMKEGGPKTSGLSTKKKRRFRLSTVAL